MNVGKRLDQIVELLAVLVERQQVKKEWYTTQELAVMLGKAEFTVREWAGMAAFGQRRSSPDAVRMPNGGCRTKNT